MNTARHGSRFLTAAALVPATLAVMLALWSLVNRDSPSSTVSADRASVTIAEARGLVGSAGRVLLRIPDGVATVSLDDTPAAREFAAELPLHLTLHDPMGQAKSGQLPSSIDVTGAEPVFDPRVGELYYWAPSNTVAIYYDDLSQSVPSPGLVRLGVVESGLASVGTSGNRFPTTIETADSTRKPSSP